MSEWTKVVTDPLGLAGFALFLVFGMVAKARKSTERRWLAPVAICLAVAALVGGLTLSYVRTSAARASAAKPESQQPIQVKQISSGPGSPNVQGVNGNVTVTVDQSSGEATKAGTKVDQKK
jgi:hypothetical protein